MPSLNSLKTKLNELVKAFSKHKPTSPEVKLNSPVALLSYYSFMLAGLGCLILPFLAIFGASNKDTDQQSYILLGAGLFAWINVYLRRYSKIWQQTPWFTRLLIIVLIVTLAISSIVNPHLSYDLLGEPYLRLGLLSMLAILGCALFFLNLNRQRLLNWLYAICCMLCLTALPYNAIRLHTLDRVGGVFAQADILAVFAGLGLLIGWQLIKKYRAYATWFYISQLLLAIVLWLTQTRSILALSILLSIIWFVLNKGLNLNKRNLTLILIALVVLAGTAIVLPNRLKSFSYDKFSITYRLDLDSAALVASAHKPLVGYGPGNVATALACQSLTSPPLKQTCHEHFYFNSSHNIFLDRTLEAGWLGGVAYLLFVVSSLARGFRSREDEVIVMSLAALLIALYYLTNVTNIDVELSFWIFLLQLNRSTKNVH